MAVQIDGSQGNVIATKGNYSGNVTIGGTLTYEDVTNVDSIGIVTARTDIHLGDKLLHYGDTNTTIRFPSADTITAETAGTERLRVTSDGDLTVGTTSSHGARFVVHETNSETDFTDQNWLSAFSGMTIENGSETDGCFTSYTSRVKNNAGTYQSGSLVFKSTNTSYAPEIHLTHRTASDVQKSRLVIDSTGRHIINHTAPTVTSDGENPFLQIKGTDSMAGMSVIRHSADASAGGIYIGKSRNATIGSNTVVQSDDELGRITFCGDDGTDINTVAAKIAAYVDATPGSNDMPGSLRFYTTADGSNSVTERLRIAKDGHIAVGGFGGPGSILDVRENKDGAETQIRLYNTDNGNTTTQTAAFYMSPDSRGTAGAGLRVIKENADFSTNAGRDISLTLNSLLNNSQVEVLRCESDADVKIVSGDLYFGTAGKGIILGATTQSDSNTLDDYEEGSWSPSYSCGSSTTLSVAATGKYVKIGLQVMARFEIKTSNTNNVSGDIGLTGLPFTSANDSVYGQVCFSFVRDWSTDFGANLRGSVNNDSSAVSLLKQASNSNEVTTHVQGSDMVQANAAENYLTGVVIYLAAS